MDLNNLTRYELKSKCKMLGVKGHSKKSKDELIKLINSKVVTGYTSNNSSIELIIEDDIDENIILSEESSNNFDINDINKLVNKLVKKLPEEIQTKIGNINKAAYDTTIPCTTKRVSQNSRIFIPYSLVRFNNLTLEKMNTHIKGVCVGIPYNIYEEIRDNLNRDELDEYLIQNIGGDNTISCIIVIMKNEGYSGSNEQRKQLTRLLEEAKKNTWIPIRRKDDIENVNEGNNKWEGQYYYNICGGEQDCLKSWSGSEPQIFTTYKNFMSDNKIICDNKICLIYLFLHVFDISLILSVEDVNKYINNIKKYLENTIYNGKTCFELLMKLRTIDKNGHLISPILCQKLSVEDFRTVKKINISHNEAVCKNKIYFCENNQKMLSDYRPGNLFWDLHLANMRQQDETIEEYWDSIKKSIVLHDSAY
jgi:hypothetical protein